MQLTCFACNATASIEAFTKDEAAGELVALAGSLPPSLWRALQAYIGLFRTSRKLSFDKALQIAKAALELSPNQAALEQAMTVTVDAIRAKGGAALKNHKYLKSVLDNQGAVTVCGQQQTSATPARSKAGQAVAALSEWGAGDWLRSGIAAGLAACVAQNLTKTPAAEMITLNADVWHLALKKSLTIEEIDAPRLHQAFEILLPRLVEWPQPKQLVEQLPKRPTRAAIRHELNDEDFQRGATMARQLKEGLGK